MTISRRVAAITGLMIAVLLFLVATRQMQLQSDLPFPIVVDNHSLERIRPIPIPDEAPDSDAPFEILPEPQELNIGITQDVAQGVAQKGVKPLVIPDLPELPQEAVVSPVLFILPTPVYHTPNPTAAPAHRVQTCTWEGKKVAAIIETRLTSNLAPIILHFSSVLGPSWPIKVFTTPSLASNLTLSLPISHLLSSGGIEFVMLPATANFSTHSAVSDFLTQRWFWETIHEADDGGKERVLIFQPDSILCSSSPRAVDDFLSYDFIGAPVRSDLGSGFNGGLSIRNIPLILSILGEAGDNTWAADRSRKNTPKDRFPGVNVDYEDQWFYAKMRERGARFPSVDVAGGFSVETIWQDRPLGYHQANVWQRGRMEEVLEWCPEYKLCTQKGYDTH